jgi:tetratricopeptide (TPR) repeat protein
MPTPSNDRINTDSPSLGSRLDGWKDIATYLAKAERTVKRWEAGRGLPIHRVPGGGRASVYAYPAELDEWLKSSSAAEPESLETAEAGNPQDLAVPSEAAPAGLQLADASGDPPHDSSRDSFVAPPDQPQISRRVASNSKRAWLWALSGLMVVALAIAALQTSGVPLSGRVHSLFATTRPKLAPGSPSAVSEAEKALARDFYLKGRYEWNQRTPDSLNRALDFFTQAVVHDPGYAQAYVGLADTYDLLREYTTMSDSEAYSRAIVAAKRAVELDDSLAEAHRALAYSEMYGSWDFVDAEKEFRRAIVLDPKNPEARRWYANAFAVQGRFPECLAQIEKAQELDPGSHATLADKGWMLYNAGRTDEAIATLNEVERSAPQFRSPHVYLMMIDLDLRAYPAYLAEGAKTADSMNDPVLKDIVASARAGYARDGGPGLLHDLYTKQKEYYATGKVPGTTLAKTCVLMGRKQEALGLLEQAYARHESDVLACLSHPDLLTLKDEPRYKALVKKINFPMPGKTSTASSLAGMETPAQRSAAITQ